MTGGAGEKRWLHAGTVGRPHGLDGSFHVSHPSPQLLALGASVVISGAEHRVIRRAGTDSRPIVRLECCEDRRAAQALAGQELLVARADAPNLEPEEWWSEDLEGCAVLAAGELVGSVSRLLALPSCDVLEVARADGNGDLLVPLVRDAVRTIDLERGRIEIDLGFLGED
jgi:16S rRNA processing protein RimM